MRQEPSVANLSPLESSLRLPTSNFSAAPDTAFSPPCIHTYRGGAYDQCIFMRCARPFPHLTSENVFTAVCTDMENETSFSRRQ